MTPHMTPKKLVPVMLLSLLASACMTATPQVDVTRFHNADTAPITPGTVAVTSILEEREDEQTRFTESLEQRTYAAAVLRELQRVGFTEATSAENSQYIARLSVDQSKLTAGGGRSPVSVGVGGSTGSYGSGVGVGIGLNLSGKPKDKIATDLAVRISKRADNSVVWEGRASVEAKEGSPAAQPGLAASKLAQALFLDFPGEAGATITVP